MNKIVYISSAFFESSLPLAKHISKNASVSFYGLFSTRFLNHANFDVSNLDFKNYSINSFEKSSINKNHPLKDYLQGSRLDVNFLVFGKNIFNIIKSIILLSKNIRKQKPDTIHFIGQSYIFIFLYILLWRHNLVHTYHEISYKRINNFQNFNLKEILHNVSISLLVKLSILSKTKIIFHSDNTSDLFSETTSYDNYKVIPFGLFEIYKNSLIEKDKEFSKDFYLFFGYVRNYKGADVLVNAAKEVLIENSKLKFIIAGMNANTLSSDSLPSNVLLIDKFLTDSEITNLISSCKAVIAPHRVASQSGIPNTSYVFNKPVLCSNIKGLSDFVIDNINGLIFESENYIELSNKILQLENDKDLYHTLVRNIQNSVNFDKFNWDIIANSTSDFYKK
jgi:glycosyltransferase involved in cell wall biosynthesis